jgi:hypothetical protein
MLEGGGFSVPSYTLSQHTRVGKPLDISRVDAWQNQLKGRDIEIFESIAGDILANLGYHCIFGTSAKSIKPSEEAFQKAIEWYRKKIVNSRNFKRRRSSHICF